MQSRRISARIRAGLHRRLKEAASRNGKNDSDIVRDALEAYLDNNPTAESCYEMARRIGVIGLVKDAPRDLSTNRRHLKGFGQ